MTSEKTGEPDLADVQREFPAWQCAEGVSGLCYALHATTGAQVQGEDALDLRDQIKAAQGRHALPHHAPSPPSPRPRLG